MEGQPDWTVPLLQLEEYPVGLEIDPSTAMDPEIIDYLRAKQKRCESENAALGIIPSEVINVQPASLHPSELPRCFVAAGLQWNTQHGLWKQKKEDGYTAVRRGAVADSSRDRCYIGVKRTLEFHQPSGAKTGWVLIQYNKLDQGTVNLAIDEKLIFYKVFELREDGQLHYQAPLHLVTSSSSPTIPEPLQEYTGSFFEDIDNMFSDFNPEHHPIYGDLLLTPLLGDPLGALVAPPEPEEGGGGRRPMQSRSAVWEHYTKILGKDPQDVYAACLCCDGLLKAHSKKHGTSPLWNHYRMHLRAAVQRPSIA